VSTASRPIEQGPGGKLPTQVAAGPEPGGGPMLAYYAYRVAEALVRVLPRRAAYALAVACVETFRTVHPAAVAGLRANLGHARADLTPRGLRALVRRNLRDLARTWVDVMAMRFEGDHISEGLVVHNIDRYQAAVEKGRGVAVISLHLGSWERGLAAGNSLGYPMALLAEYLRPPQLFERVVGSRVAQGVKVVPIDIAAIRSGDSSTARRLGAAAMREVLRILRGGGAIALAMDRDLIGNGEPYEFFGAPARIPVGVIDVAVRSGAVILPVILPRIPSGTAVVVHPEIPYDTRAPRDAEIRRVVGEVLRLFEQVISEYPEQWHVLDPVWDS
jgi:lauroyl/myristoyl acyltransferase